MKVLLAGGGTGGHINPALAIAEIIKTKYEDAEFLFAGTPNGMESKLIPQAGYKIETIKVAGFQRKLNLNNVKRNIQAMGYLALSGKRAKEIISGFKPDIAIGTGGYVAGPIIRKAAKMNIPTAIHEQNAYPGITNKILSKEVDHVMLTVQEALEYMDKGSFEYTVTGLPVRDGIRNNNRENARKKLGLNNDLCILSFGGSLGAGCINDTMADVIKWHTSKNLNINHIHGYGGMGKDSFPKKMNDAQIPLKNNRLRITEYINDMDTCIAAADIVVCRSGATTLSELQAAGRASILIPSPIVAGNHQLHNAKVLEKAGASIVIEQKDVTSQKIIDILEDLYNNPKKIMDMAKNASGLNVNDTTEKILSVVDRLYLKALEKK